MHTKRLILVKQYFTSIFFLPLYVDLDQKNLFPLECKASKDSSTVFLSGCMMKGNYNLQQWEQVYNKKNVLPSAQHILVRFMVTAVLLHMCRTEMSGGTSRIYHSRLQLPNKISQSPCSLSARTQLPLHRRFPGNSMICQS